MRREGAGKTGGERDGKRRKEEGWEMRVRRSARKSRERGKQTKRCGEKVGEEGE